MNEYGKRVGKKMEEYMGNPDSIDQEVHDLKEATEGVQVRGALAASVSKSFTKSKWAEEKAIEQTERVDTLIKENPQPSEVVDARGNFPILRDRLNSVDSQLAQTSQQLINLSNNKMDKAVGATKQELQQKETEIISYLDNQLTQIGSMTPRGAYATLQDLVNAYPNGTEGVYVVQEDGNWYYWNGNQWTIGGVYQATPWDEFMTEQDEEWVI